MRRKSGLFYVMITGVALVVILLIWGIASYNSLVGLSANIESSQGDIQTMLQRRSDLIPNLVSTVKGYASHETAAIKAVTDARAKLAGAKGNTDQAAASDQLTSALSRLLVVVENYPNLKADANFRQLSDELAGTENRIAYTRTTYNDKVKSYNAKIRSFPTNIIAGMFGFNKADYFTAAKGAETVPKVNF
ncbi:MAG TPA: LemA family protein [Clostridia bacterium]|nr:LemA family protein [Clostridia bacterium]